MDKKTADDALTMARSLAQNVSPRAEEADRLGRMPAEDIKALTESGYSTLSIPTQYGGYGLGLRDCVAAQLELAQGSGSLALVAGMQLHVFGHALANASWPDDIVERFCTAAAAGGLFNSVATEPDLGSPSRGAFFKTTAVESDGGYVINGLKSWTTGGKFLTHLLVSLDLNGDPAVILVEGDRAGLTWTETWGDGLVMRASESHDAVFTDVWVPHENLVGIKRREKQKNVWFPLLMTAIYLGEAIAARNCVIEYVLERVPTALGKPVATLPKIQRQIGELDVTLQAARAFLLDTAAGWDGENYAPIAAAKYFAVEAAQTVTDQALRIAGGAGVTRDLPLERYFRDVRAGSMQPPSGDTALELVGRAAISELGELS